MSTPTTNGHCAGCYHLSPIGGGTYCNYIGNMGHRRPCPAGSGCTVKITRKEWLEKMRAARTVWTPELLERLKQLVREGYDDIQIADKLGIRADAVTSKRRTLKQETLSEVEALTEEYRKTLDGFTPCDASGKPAEPDVPETDVGDMIGEAIANSPDFKSNVQPPAAQRIVLTEAMPGPSAPAADVEPEPPAETQELHVPFKDEATEMLYQLLCTATPDTYVSIDFDQLSSVSVNVRFSDGKLSERVIVLR